MNTTDVVFKKGQDMQGCDYHYGLWKLNQIKCEGRAQRGSEESNGSGITGLQSCWIK